MQKLFFDIESTGPDVSKDKIVQLAVIVIDENGKIVFRHSKKFNPGIKISKEATAIHGIKDSDVKNCVSFKDDAKKLKKLFQDKIIITYNGMVFDIPLLLNEFERAGVDVEFSGKFFDVLKIERKLAGNTLSEVYKRYTGEELDGAHDALVDVEATDVILNHQMKKINSLLQPNETMEEALMRLSGTKDIVDFSGKLGRDDEGYLTFKFGKEKDKRVVDRPEYAAWILNSNFSKQVKDLIRAEQSKKVLGTSQSKSKGFYQANPRPKSSLFEDNSVIKEIESIDDLPF